MTNNIPNTFTGSIECSGVRGCSIKGSHLSAWHTVGINVKESEREMKQVTAVGKGTTFFLLLVLAVSASATSLNTTQQNTAITATSGKQVRGVWGARAQGSLHFKSMWEHLQCTPYNRILSLYFLQKKAILSFPLKACTSSNAGEMWTAEGGAQVDSVWVCQNNKWIPYEWVATNVIMESHECQCNTSLEMKAI